MTTGLVKLYRRGSMGRYSVIGQKVYCSVEDRRKIIESWSKQYDTIFNNCYLQIRPSLDNNLKVEKPMKPEKLKELQVLSRERYNALSPLTLQQKVEQSIENESTKSEPPVRELKKYKPIKQIVRSRQFEEEPVKKIIRPKAVYDNDNRSLYNK